MPTVELTIKVNGVERATQQLPVRKTEVLLEDLGVTNGTVTEQAEAVLAWIVARGRDALSTDDVTFGSRQYDVMLAAVFANDPVKDAAWVMQNGIIALEAAYDALP